MGWWRHQQRVKVLKKWFSAEKQNINIHKHRWLFVLPPTQLHTHILIQPGSLIASNYQSTQSMVNNSYCLRTLHKASKLITCSIYSNWGCSTDTPNTCPAGVLSSMRLTEWVNSEGIGWCVAYCEVSTGSNDIWTTWPHPFHCRVTNDPIGNGNITCQTVLLAKNWNLPLGNNHQFCIHCSGGNKS